MSIKILVATPCTGEVSTDYFFGALSCHHFPKEKAEFDFFIHEGGSLLSKTRDNMVAEFLHNPRFKDHDFMVFIDSDQSFSGLDIWELVSSNVDFCAAVVPYKKVRTDNIYMWSIMDYNAIEDERHIPDFEDMIPATSEYNFHGMMEPDAEDGIENPAVKEIVYVGTGMLMMSRKGLETMNSKIEEKWLYEGKKETAVMFNSIMLDGKYMGEDFSFCHRVRESGMKVYANLSINVNHTGKFTFKGDVSKMMEFISGVKDFVQQNQQPNN